jgi:heme-degrading monooxygenase HmoA
MIVRLTFCKFIPERVADAKKVYNEEVIPVVKKQKGNVGCRLLEPANKTDDYISVTEWKTKEDAEAYHTSGVYKSLVTKLQAFFTKQPELKTFTAEDVLKPSAQIL